MKFICFLLILSSFSPAFAGNAVIFSGNDVKTLKSSINLFDAAKILTGNANPTLVAQDAPRGSIYLRTGASGGSVYSKQDNGLTTNWTILSSTGVITIDEFSNPFGGTLVGARNGINKVFTVNQAPAAGGLFNVLINGVLLDPNDWSLLGQIVTLGAAVTAPAAFESISVNYQFGTPATTIIAEFSNPSGGTLTGARNGVNKIFDVSNIPLPGGLFNVHINGVMLDPNDWSLAGTTVTLGAAVTAPAVFESVVVNYEY